MLIYLLFHRVAFKNLLKNLKQFNRNRYGFYECGYRSKNELNLNFNIHMFIVCSLTILYDAEGSILIFFLINLNILSIADFILLLIFILTFILGFAFENYMRTTEWFFY
jgi:NADH:ubiquinone oxidoreductase subunit 3 (subunit A)